MAKFHKIDMPVDWASYLINGDASGLEDGEQAVCDAYLKQQGIKSVVGCEEDSHFSWSYGLNGGTSEGGDLCEYTVELYKKDKQNV